MMEKEAIINSLEKLRKELESEINKLFKTYEEKIENICKSSSEKYETETSKRFQTIREVADSGLVSRAFLLGLQADGKLPGIYAGTRFYVDMPKLYRYLDEQVAASIKQTD